MQNNKNILAKTVIYIAVTITFLLPVKFGTMAGLPEITIFLPFSDIITAFIHIWPPVLFSFISGILLLLTLIITFPDNDNREKQSEKGFISEKMPTMNVIIPVCSIALLLGTIPGFVNASVCDFPLIQILHFSGITAYACAVYIIIQKCPETKIFFLNAIAASTAVITLIGLQQYLFGFKETLKYIQQQEAETGIKISSGIMNRLLQTRIYATFSLCNSLAAHLILTAPVTLFATLKYPSTLKRLFQK
jgi:cytochrome bd-type quinol oxidase subunit 2